MLGSAGSWYAILVVWEYKDGAGKARLVHAYIHQLAISQW